MLSWWNPDDLRASWKRSQYMSFCFNERDDCSFTYRDGWTLRKHSWSTSRTHKYFEWKGTASVKSGRNNLSQHVLHIRQHYSTLKVNKFWACQTKQCNRKLFFKIDWFNAYIPIANDQIHNEHIFIGWRDICKINCVYTMNWWLILSLSRSLVYERVKEKGSESEREKRGTKNNHKFKQASACSKIFSHLLYVDCIVLLYISDAKQQQISDRYGVNLTSLSLEFQFNIDGNNDDVYDIMATIIVGKGNNELVMHEIK